MSPKAHQRRAKSIAIFSMPPRCRLIFNPSARDVINEEAIHEVYVDFTRPAAAAFRKLGVKRVVGMYGSSESFAEGYVDMMRAKNEGMDNVAERTASTRTPTTFRKWCEQELKPLVPALPKA